MSATTTIVKADGLNSTSTVVTKPGWKTSEFWLTVLATVVGLAYASGVVGDGTQADHALGALTIALTHAGYAVSRGIAKKQS